MLSLYLIKCIRLYGMPKAKTITRTSSLRKDLVEALEKEARDRELSTSALMNQTIDRSIHLIWPSEKTGSLVIAHDIVKSLAEAVSSENIRKIAAISAQIHKNTAMVVMGTEQKLESVLNLFETSYGKNSRWFKWSNTVNGRDNRILLIHELGQNWSIFLEAYFKSFFMEMLDIQVKSSYTDKTVVFEFKA